MNKQQILSRIHRERTLCGDMARSRFCPSAWTDSPAHAHLMGLLVDIGIATVAPSMEYPGKTKFNVAPSQDLPKTTRGWNHVGHVKETPNAGPEDTYNLWIRTGKERGEPYYEYKGPGDSRIQGWFYPVTDEKMPYLTDTEAIILTTKEGHRLIAQVSGDADCPGIYLILQPKDGKDQTVGLMEFIPKEKREETTCEKGNGVFRLITWNDGKAGEDPDEIRNIRETD